MVLYLGMDQSLVRFFYDKDSLDYKRSLLHKCIRVPILLCGIALLAVFAMVKTNMDFRIGQYSVGTFMCLYVHSGRVSVFIAFGKITIQVKDILNIEHH